MQKCDRLLLLSSSVGVVSRLLPMRNVLVTRQIVPVYFLDPSKPFSLYFDTTCTPSLSFSTIAMLDDGKYGNYRAASSSLQLAHLPCHRANLSDVDHIFEANFGALQLTCLNLTVIYIDALMLLYMDMHSILDIEPLTTPSSPRLLSFFAPPLGSDLCLPPLTTINLVSPPILPQTFLDSNLSDSPTSALDRQHVWSGYGMRPLDMQTFDRYQLLARDCRPLESWPHIGDYLACVYGLLCCPAVGLGHLNHAKMCNSINDRLRLPSNSVVSVPELLPPS